MAFRVPVLNRVAAMVFAAFHITRARRVQPAQCRGKAAWSHHSFPGRTDGPMGGAWAYCLSQAGGAGHWPGDRPVSVQDRGAHPGIGAAGLITAFYRDWGFRAAGAAVACGFLDGAALGHLVHIAETGNMATGTAGPVLYADIVTPPSQLVLLALTFRPARRGA